MLAQKYTPADTAKTQSKFAVHFGCGLINGIVQHVGIYVHRGRELRVTKELLRCLVVHACLVQGGRVPVPDLVRRDRDAALCLVGSI